MLVVVVSRVTEMFSVLLRVLVAFLLTPGEVSIQSPVPVIATLER